MPVLKHAKKKLRQDKKRTIRNKELKNLFKKLVKQARENKTLDAVNKAFSGIDKATKNNIIHKNKAARMKSSLAKIISGKASSSAKASEDKPVKKKVVEKTKPTVKKAVKKTSPKKK